MTPPDEAVREPDQLDGVPLPEHCRRVFGHDRARERLNESISSRRVPGGVLLHGPRGVGKASLAFEFARDLLVTTGDEERHRVDEQVDAGSHPNLFVLRRGLRDTGKGYSAFIRVEEVRNLIDRLRRTRGRPGYRVAIIDSIDDCNQNAANALLKILEEPPPETVFVLVSHQPGGLLPTIRSRCQSLALRPLAEDDLTGLLEDAGIEAERIPELTAIAGGRPRRAFEYLNLGQADAVVALRGFLAAPERAGQGATLGLADLIAGAPEAERQIARDMVLEHIADQAQNAARSGLTGNQLASRTQLWDKAVPLFANAETYNLDTTETFVIVLDALRANALAAMPS
nr:AAA family ATPase [uncultured Sphaerochaeta sp.]